MHRPTLPGRTSLFFFAAGLTERPLRSFWSPPPQYTPRRFHCSGYRSVTLTWQRPRGIEHWANASMPPSTPCA